MQRRRFLTRASALTATFALGGGARAAYSPSVVIGWTDALLASIAATRMQAPMAARAIAMLHEASYNAWTAYDATAAFTLGGLSRQPLAARSTAAKAIAICWAAHTVLADLFPLRRSLYDSLLASGTPGTGLSTADAAAAAVGRAAGNALLGARRNDGANQMGDLAPGAYADYTGFWSINTPDLLLDPTRWQPLRVVDTGTGQTVVQQFLAPHWGRVRPFAMGSGRAFRPWLGPLAPTLSEMLQLVDYSAALNDASKAQVDFWAANPGSVSPPGQWMQIAQQVSANDGQTLDKDVKLFFGCGQALLDASIAAWDAKRAFDTVRPISAIRYFLRGQAIRAWGGPGKGTVTMLGQQWMPFQRPSNPTPPFPEFISGHSTFSAAAASVLAGLRGSDGILLKGTLRVGQVAWELPPFPAQEITLNWSSLPIAADSAGLSRRLGGIHFERGDLTGRSVGRQVGDLVLARCRALFEGRNV